MRRKGVHIVHQVDVKEGICIPGAHTPQNYWQQRYWYGDDVNVVPGVLKILRVWASKFLDLHRHHTKSTLFYPSVDDSGHRYHIDCSDNLHDHLLIEDGPPASVVCDVSFQQGRVSLSKDLEYRISARQVDASLARQLDMIQKHSFHIPRRAHWMIA